MRVKELADLTRTTVRTIRYYHQLGLLPLPPVVGGWRDYDTAAATQVWRIRRLADAGVPLARIAALVDAEGSARAPHDPGASLAAVLQETLTRIDEEIEAAHRRRSRAQALLRSAERGTTLTGLPPEVERVYDVLAGRARDEATCRAVRSERDFMELALHRGDLPPGAAAAYACFDEERIDDSLAVFVELGTAGRATLATSDRLVTAVVDRFRRHLGPQLGPVARCVDRERAGRAVDLYARVVHPQDPALGRRLAGAVVAVLATAQAE